MSEKISRDRYELARLTLHQPQIELEAYIRAIRTEINQTVKLAIREALDKHTAASSAMLTPTTPTSATSSTTGNPAFNNNNNNNREKNSANNANVSLIELELFICESRQIQSFCIPEKILTTIVETMCT